MTQRISDTEHFLFSKLDAFLLKTINSKEIPNYIETVENKKTKSVL